MQSSGRNSSTNEVKGKSVTTYSGYDGSQKITPNGKLQECEKFNGNCVLIPQCVFKKGWQFLIGLIVMPLEILIMDIGYGSRL